MSLSFSRLSLAGWDVNALARYARLSCISVIISAPAQNSLFTPSRSIESRKVIREFFKSKSRTAFQLSGCSRIADRNRCNQGTSVNSGLLPTRCSAITADRKQPYSLAFSRHSAQKLEGSAWVRETYLSSNRSAKTSWSTAQEISSCPTALPFSNHPACCRLRSKGP